VAQVNELLGFLRQVRQSRLLTEAQWDRLQQTVSDERLRSPAGIVSRLVAQGDITPWQGEMLLAGKRSFQLGKYRLEDLLGTGASGTVFLARQTGLERLVAVKVLAPEMVRDRQLVARFQRETQSLAAVTSPHLVTAFDAESHGALHYLVMEYVPGEDLGQVLRREGRLSVPLACECVRQALLGLQTAAEAGLVHRDLKPGNLLLSRSPETDGPVVRVLDFGLAKFRAEVARRRQPARVPASTDQELTHDGALLGTPDYMSPEQARETLSADIRSDIYSLGCTLYRLLTGDAPFPGERTRAQILARAPGAERDRIQRGDIPAPLRPVLAKFLAVDPQERYQTPRDAARALAPFAHGARLPDTQDQTPPSWEPTHATRPGEPPDQLEDFFRRLELSGESAAEDLGRRRDVSPAWSRAWRAVREWRRPLFRASLALAALLAGMWLARPSLTIELPPNVDVQGEIQDSSRVWQVSELNHEAAGQLRIFPGSGRVWGELRREGFEPVPLEVELGWFQWKVVRPDWQPTAEAQRRARVAGVIDQLAATVSGQPEEQSLQAAQRLLGQIRGTPEVRDLARALARWPVPVDTLRGPAEWSAQLGGVGLGDAAREVVQVLGSGERQAWNRSVGLVASQTSPLVAGVSIDQTVQVWNSATLTRVAAWSLAVRPVAAGFCDVSPRLLVALEDGRIVVHDPETGAERAVLWGALPPWSITPDGTLVVAVRQETVGGPELGVWELSSGRQRHTWPTGDSRPVRDLLCLSADQVVVEHERGGVIVHDLPTGRPIVAWPRASAPRSDTRRRWLAVAEPVENVVVFDLSHPLSGTAAGLELESAGTPLHFLEETDQLLTRNASRVLIWNPRTGEEQRTILDVPGVSLVMGQPATLVAADDSLAEWCRWDLASGARLSVESPALLTQLAAPEKGILSDSVPSGSEAMWRGALWGGGERPGFEVWNVATGEREDRNGEWHWPATLDEEGRQLACRRENAIHVLDIVSGATRARLPRRIEEHDVLTFSLTGRHLAIRGGWGVFRSSLEVWNLQTATRIPLEELPSGRVSALGWSPGDSAVALAHDDRQIWIQALDGGTPRSITVDLPGVVRAVEFSADGGMLAIACDDRSHWLLDLQTEQLQRLPGAVARVERWRFSADGRFLLGVVNDRVLLYSVPRRRLIRSFAATEAGLNDAVFSATGEALAIATNGGRVEIWDLSELKKGVPAQRMALALGPPGGRLWEVRLTPEGRHVVTLNGNSTVSVIRPREGLPTFRGEPPRSFD
jgi:serine/threonine protein kinase/WD40 repeat protein